jgi:hypothetical protein
VVVSRTLDPAGHEKERAGVQRLRDATKENVASPHFRTVGTGQNEWFTPVDRAVAVVTG